MSVVFFFRASGQLPGCWLPGRPSRLAVHYGYPVDRSKTRARPTENNSRVVTSRRQTNGGPEDICKCKVDGERGPYWARLDDVVSSVIASK